MTPTSWSSWCATAISIAPSRHSTASERAREIHGSLDPQCLSGFRKNEKFEIERSDVILTVDNGDFIFFDCAYEELLQSLGPINDTASVPWTMFNDNVSMGFFGIYDQYILNLLYDPRIKAGMTVAEVKEVLPAVLVDVRAWVKQGQQSAGIDPRHCEPTGPLRLQRTIAKLTPISRTAPGRSACGGSRWCRRRSRRAWRRATAARSDSR